MLIVLYVHHLLKSDSDAETTFSDQSQSPSLLSFRNTVLVALVSFSVSGLICWQEKCEQANQAWRRVSSNNILYCRNNLKQQSIAMLNHSIVNKSFPDYHFSSTNQPELHSWQTHLLPYVDSAALSRKINYAKTWDAPENKPYFQYPIYAYQMRLAQSLPTIDIETGYALTHYSANAHVLGAANRLLSMTLSLQMVSRTP
ncbi:MAG: DUF1559 domain-containing protein [Planctomycetaceae bacterium]